VKAVVAFPEGNKGGAFLERRKKFLLSLCDKNGGKSDQFLGFPEEYLRWKERKA